ncbi:AAA family ATPase [Hymenobacter sp. CRA2]|uniref:AAA family ATPase n=1 Tax=Hymenobacter sp. CRA2 TaxID=1955620 RepID=UPI00098EE9B0|nr:AAA family ATPase [Hymenobacter sp. CRA2]OON70192.1 hypothetical protein B0919_05515 [Hymenobacter sp. CRA2]
MPEPSERAPRGLVVGKFAPLHRGHQLLLETAATQVQELHVWVYSEPDWARAPAAVRAEWIRRIYGEALHGARLHVRALSKTDHPALPANAAPDADHREFVCQQLLELGLAIDVVFTSETYGQGFAEYIGARHVLVDLARRQLPVSGTQVRADVYGSDAWLHSVVQAHFRSASYVQRVVLLGAESTGKSTLTAALGRQFGTAWVAEYGRTLYEEKQGQLTYDDLLRIARRHRALEDEALPAARHWLFSDTNAVTTLWYSYAYFGRAEPELHALARACRERYTYTFVCAPDFPFEQDGTRASAEVQAVQQSTILLQLDLLGIPYQLLTGSIAERIEQVAAVLGSAVKINL